MITLANVTDKIISTPRGRVNAKAYIPKGVTGKVAAIVFFPGLGESDPDWDGSTMGNPDLLYNLGPFRNLKAGWTPDFCVFAFQTPYHGGPGPGEKPLFVRACLSEVLSGLYPVDPNKITLTGLSYGAAHVFDYVQHEDDAFYKPIAAIIPMSMNVYPSANDARFAKMGNWGFVGKLDNDYNTAMPAFYQYSTKNGYPNAFTVVANGAHNAITWNLGYDQNYVDPVTKTNIYDWSQQFTANAAVQPPPVVTDPAPVKTLVSATMVLKYSDGSTVSYPN